MAGKNNFYPYGESSTNILNNSEYQTDQERTAGAARGAIARSKIYNKALRQSAAGAYAVADLVAAAGKDADDANAATLAENFRAAVSYQARAFVASAVSVSGGLATATVDELASTTAADLPALFSLAMVLDQSLPAGASVKITSSLPGEDLTYPIYSGGAPVEADAITSGAIALLIDTIGKKAFFRAGGGSKIPETLPPLNPNFTLARSEDGTKITVKADKLLVGGDTSMLAGGVWVYKANGVPQNPKDGTVKKWTREELTTVFKYDGMYLGDVTASDAANEVLLWLPENDSGKVKLVPFIILSTDYLGGVYVVRKNTYTSGIFGSNGKYESGEADMWCSSTYFNSIIGNGIKEFLLECNIQTNESTSIKRKVFLLDAKEVGFTEFGYGTLMPYFSSTDNRHATNNNGISANWFTRTYKERIGCVVVLSSDGTFDNDYTFSGRSNYRPAFVLPKDFKIQKRPDGSYTVWNEMGLMTLGDIEASTEEIAVYLNIEETSNNAPYLYLASNYQNSKRGLVCRKYISEKSNFVDPNYALGMIQYLTSWGAKNLAESVRVLVESISYKYRKSTYANGRYTFAPADISSKYFLLSICDLGYNESIGTGTTLPYFKVAVNRIATNSKNNAENYFTRDILSQSATNSADIYRIDPQGDHSYGSYNNVYGIRPAFTLPLTAPIRKLADGTYDLVPDDPALSQPATIADESPLEWTFQFPETTPCYVRQYTFNQKGQYQTMLQGAVVSTLDKPPYSAVLSENTWEQIAQACADDDPILDKWKIGDTKDESINGETLTFAIVGKNIDDLADGSGKAHLTFGMTQLMAARRQMNGTSTNKNSFVGTSMYAFLRDVVYAGMPSKLKNAIKSVNKKTSQGNKLSLIQTDAMHLWLFSEYEIFGTYQYSYEGEGTHYPYFSTSAKRIKRLSNGTGSANNWWTRSPRSSTDYRFCHVDSSGATQGSYNPTDAMGVCFGFCI